MKNLINVTDLTEQEIEELIDIAAEMMAAPEDYLDLAKGKILATLFFEPSTRTRLSFTSAMMSLGGNVLGFSEAGSSSSAKVAGISIVPVSASKESSSLTSSCTPAAPLAA